MNRAIPSKDECLNILKKYKTPKSVIKHCTLVAEIALEISSKIDNIDKELVVAGAMLHDIGRSIDIGVGITKNEAKKLGLPVRNYIPTTPEEIIVSYADNLACGSRKCSFAESLNSFIRKFGDESEVVKGFYRQKEFIENLTSKK
ncbi:MAG: HDIG domain-containing metalloprotein [Candidatus Heimdallarchaeaceae archaeon]